MVERKLVMARETGILLRQVLELCCAACPAWLVCMDTEDKMLFRCGRCNAPFLSIWVASEDSKMGGSKLSMKDAYPRIYGIPSDCPLQISTRHYTSLYNLPSFKKTGCHQCECTPMRPRARLIAIGGKVLEENNEQVTDNDVPKRNRERSDENSGQS